MPLFELLFFSLQVVLKINITDKYKT